MQSTIGRKGTWARSLMECENHVISHGSANTGCTPTPSHRIRKRTQLCTRATATVPFTALAPYSGVHA
eukprot:1638274-Rhodomonas_salina.3